MNDIRTPANYSYYHGKDLPFILEHLEFGENTKVYWGANAALQGKLFELQEGVAKAQIEAAEATKETARYTRDNARWMFWSVMALLLTSGAQALIAIMK
jgi:hypothetical protein